VHSTKVTITKRVLATGAEIVYRSASNFICITRSLASRFVDEIALV
jgi:hypothetical protein